MILIDGGKGQLSAAVEVIPEGIKTIGIAKRDEQIIIDKTKSGIDKKWFESSETKMMNEVLVENEDRYLIVNLHASQTHSHGHAKNLLGEDNSSFSDLTKLFQRIRDESHRFAINYHSSLRSKNQTKNILESIDGIGPKTRAKLLRKFGSLQNIKNTNTSDLEKIVGKKTAVNLKNHFKD